jgi:hypothetical protein
VERGPDNGCTRSTQKVREKEETPTQEERRSSAVHNNRPAQIASRNGLSDSQRMGCRLDDQALVEVDQANEPERYARHAEKHAGVPHDAAASAESWYAAERR